MHIQYSIFKRLVKIALRGRRVGEGVWVPPELWRQETSCSHGQLVLGGQLLLSRQLLVGRQLLAAWVNTLPSYDIL